MDKHSSLLCPPLTTTERATTLPTSTNVIKQFNDNPENKLECLSVPSISSLF
jgi:hypothetical protein